MARPERMADAKAYSRIAARLEPIVDTPVGPVHHWPPFTKHDPGVGQLSGTPPGYDTKRLLPRRPFRGTDFQIHAKRGKRALIRVDGKPIEGDFIPVPKRGLGKAPVHIVCEVKS